MGGSRSIWVGLGANLGDASATIKAALQHLREAAPRLQASSLYRSAAIGAPGPDYINAVARFDSAASPEALLEHLQALEQRFGRTRPYPQAPRTLDLDLLLAGDEQRTSARLTLPHPRLLARAFVLRPMAEIDPHLQLAGRPIGDWLSQVADQDCTRLPEEPGP